MDSENWQLIVFIGVVSVGLIMAGTWMLLDGLHAGFRHGWSHPMVYSYFGLPLYTLPTHFVAACGVGLLVLGFAGLWWVYRLYSE
jgi:hypothetical protein